MMDAVFELTVKWILYSIKFVTVTVFSRLIDRRTEFTADCQLLLASDSLDGKILKLYIIIKRVNPQS